MPCTSVKLNVVDDETPVDLCVDILRDDMPLRVVAKNGKAYFVKCMQSCRCKENGEAQRILDDSVVRACFCKYKDRTLPYCYVVMHDGGIDLMDALMQAQTPEKNVSDTQVLEALWRAARDVCALHNCGRVHGDIKPENMLLERYGMIDFDTMTRRGSARSAEHTPDYCADDTACFATEAMDCYSLAVACGVALFRRMPPTRFKVTHSNVRLWCSNNIFTPFVVKLFKCTSAQQIQTCLRQAIQDLQKSASA